MPASVTGMLVVRIVKRFTVLVAGTLVVYLLAATVSAFVPAGEERSTDDAVVRIFVSSDGIHTDIVVPTMTEFRDWSVLLVDVPVSVANLRQSYVAFGWGDRGFYLQTRSWSDLKLSTALMALTGLNGSVLHLQAMGTPWESDQMRSVMLTAAQYRRLTDFIDQSFAHDATGAPTVIANEHYNAFDEFYVATGGYSPIKTCNEWAREALAAAGVRVPLWAPFATGLFKWLPVSDPRTPVSASQGKTSSLP